MSEVIHTGGMKPFTNSHNPLCRNAKPAFSRGKTAQ
jgi:hypothetical protein